jgi:hypothetical protein
MLSSSPTTPLGQGWMVNGPGGVDFPAGQWNFNLRIRVWGGAAGSPAGETRVGAWAVKLNGTGGIQSSRLIVDPGSATDLTSTENISQTAANLFNVDYEVNLPAFYVASDEHLLFEVYRDQTAAYSGPGSTDSRLATLYSYDNVSRVARLASVGTVPNQPTLQSPADAATTDALPTLSATFSDPDSGDTGKVKFKICKASDCSDGADPVASGTSSVTTLSSGQDGAWTPGVALTTGSYYWLAKNVDANGGPSAWSTARAITIDADPPDTSITSAAPVEPTNSTAASFSFTSADAGASFECKLDSGLFAACGSPKSYSGLGAGAHTFSVRAVDSVGNQDASPATYSWNVDLTPPDVTIDSGPSNPTNSRSASFAFSSTDGTATFACKLDAGSYGACTSPTSYSGIAEGTHTFSVQATDPAGNVSTASSTWDVDLTAPDISIDSGPSDPTNATAASLAFSSADSTATFECKLDTGSFAACASPAGYSGLSDGLHTFTVRATDGVGNSASASYSWQVDVTAPDTSVDSGPSDPTAGTSADLSFSANETGSTFECDLDGAGFSTCTSPETYSALADGVHVFSVRATDAAGNVDASPAVFAWTVDTAGPGRPQGFRGAVGADGLSLSWAAPLDGTPDSYILYVDGVATQTLSGTTTSRLVGAFSPNDTRRFSLAAADSLGNVGPRTAALVGVPAVQGLTVSHTRTSLEARGLRLGAVHRVLTSTRSGRIVRQAPVAPGVARLGSPVRVGVSQRRIELKSARTLECAIGGRLSARIKLATPLSYLEARFYANGRRFDLARGFGWRRAGTRWYSLRLSYLLARPALYEVRWNTVTATGIVVSSHQWIRIRRLRAGETNPPPCSPA